MSKSAYCVFPANKTGTKREGYPELDSKLLISKINMRKFFLEEVNKTFSLISTEFNLERKYGLEKKGGSDGACCQLFKILKAWFSTNNNCIFHPDSIIDIFYIHIAFNLLSFYYCNSITIS